MQENPPQHRRVPGRALRRVAAAGAVAVAASVSACGSEAPAPAEGERVAAAPAERTGPPHPAPGTALAGYDFSADPDPGTVLPRGLEEASGLDVDTAGRLYVHGDETGVVFRFEGPGTATAARFGAGRPVLRADFEGIAAAGGRLYLVESGGTLVSVVPGEDGQAVPHRALPTRLGEVCEVEGLARDPVWATLLLACKEPRAREARGRIRLYHYSLHRERLDGLPVIDTPLEELERLGLAPELHPSGVVIHPATDSYLVLAAREGLVVELNRAGHPVAAVELPPGALPQAEGIAVDPDGSLWIATEGAGGAGRLFRWPWQGGS